MQIQFIGGAGVSDDAATLVVDKPVMISAFATNGSDTPVQPGDVTYAWTWPTWLPTFPRGYDWPADAQQTQFVASDDLVGRVAEVGVTITTEDGQKASKTLKCTIAKQL
ncbi:hypothetical protein [Nocardia salmonicida]|uniref:hypothetical protein n=1 Tax=Nocardia salmonicida TaxID=53431 RepID=UPI0007A44B43|nr:hypothetical protein [Nocardia salmonicida]